MKTASAAPPAAIRSRDRSMSKAHGLAIRWSYNLTRLRLNRGTAGSGTGIVSSALGPDYFRNLKMAEHFSGE